MMDHGKKILLKTFWCSKGWRYEDPTPEEYRLALEAGYFLPVRQLPDHETAMAEMNRLLDRLPLRGAVSEHDDRGRLPLSFFHNCAIIKISIQFRRN